jgi:hypothetical protein
LSAMVGAFDPEGGDDGDQKEPRVGGFWLRSSRRNASWTGGPLNVLHRQVHVEELVDVLRQGQAAGEVGESFVDGQVGVLIGPKGGHVWRSLR